MSGEVWAQVTQTDSCIGSVGHRRALIIALIALMVSLGGTGYAAFTLPRNSVGNKQSRAARSQRPRAKRHSLTGAQINLRKLGTVPTARDAAVH